MSLIDLTGQNFGRLTVQHKAAALKDGVTRWLCVCACGTTKIVRSKDLRRGRTTSCGCLQREETVARSTTHGMSGSAEYKIWAGMIKRCDDAVNANYGGRGITVCERWREFENFLADLGPRTSARHSLERLDNLLGYQPGNVTWALHKQQMRNTRRTRPVLYRGRQMAVSEAVEIAGSIVTPQNAISRLNRGWTVESAVATKPGPRKGGRKSKADRS